MRGGASCSPASELEGDAWRVPANATTKFKELFAASAGQGVEGLVLKKQSSAYAPGRRTGDWLLVQRRRREEKGRRAVSLTANAEPTAKNKILASGSVGASWPSPTSTRSSTPPTGFTNCYLIDAYADLAEVLLPHLRGRPVTLKRYPDGVEGKFFYEKRSPNTVPTGCRPPASPPTALKGRDRHTTDRGPAESYAWAANLADIELHVALARADDPDRPESLVFDLDPGTPADVLYLRRRRPPHRLALQPSSASTVTPKTSGSKGIHLHVPLNGTATFAESRPFAKALAETFEARFPDEVDPRQTLVANARARC